MTQCWRYGNIINPDMWEHISMSVAELCTILAQLDQRTTVYVKDEEGSLFVPQVVLDANNRFVVLWTSTYIGREGDIP